MITDLPTKRIYAIPQRHKHFSEFLPTRWLQKLNGIDMEQNYITVTLCICSASVSYYARESDGLCFYRCWFVCLSVRLSVCYHDN